MTQNTTFGTMLLEFFLRITVWALMAVLITIPLTFIAKWIGLFDAL